MRSRTRRSPRDADRRCSLLGKKSPKTREPRERRVRTARVKHTCVRLRTRAITRSKALSPLSLSLFPLARSLSVEKSARGYSLLQSDALSLSHSRAWNEVSFWCAFTRATSDEMALRDSSEKNRGDRNARAPEQRSATAVKCVYGEPHWRSRRVTAHCTRAAHVARSDRPASAATARLSRARERRRNIVSFSGAVARAARVGRSVSLSFDIWNLS